MHNVDYGFAPSVTGMRLIWVGFTLVRTTNCWVVYFVADRGALLWAVVSTLLVSCP